MAKSISRSKVELVNVYPDQFDPSTKSAHVKQSVVTSYDYSRSPFVKGQREFTSERYCFVAVPAEWDDAKIADAIQGGAVQRHLGCIPQSVMSEGQLARYRALSGDEAQAFLDNFENRHRLVTSEGNEILFEGFATFGRNVFVLDPAIQDVDQRQADVATMLAHDDTDSPFIEERQVATA